MRTVMSKADTSKAVSSILKGLDADGLKAFLANTKQVWQEEHPESQRRRGRPSEKHNVLLAIWETVAAYPSARKLTQGKLIRLVQERLANDAPSEDTIRKYVKMWFIL